MLLLDRMYGGHKLFWSKVLCFMFIFECFKINNWNIVALEQTLLVNTTQGTVMGKYLYLPNQEKVRAFLGIPYAEPPIGKCRFMESKIKKNLECVLETRKVAQPLEAVFQKPIPKQKWTNVFNATAFGAFCYQPLTQTVWDIEESQYGKKSLRQKWLKEYPMSEDCLTVNIYTPIVSEAENPLTVMVYFHGGSYYMNGGRLYPGEKLASLGVILVTFNYRLGPLGFLSTENEASIGNYGLLDQVLVLKWVQQNIRAFGGDPANVAIFGNSAGGASVSLHMLSPLSKGLFSTAIAQSGCAHAPWAIQHQPRTYAIKLARNLDCPSESSQDLVECLRTFSAEQILKKSSLASGLLVPFAPVIDGPFGGSFLPDHPTKLLRDGNFHGSRIPFITGVTKDEVSIWFQVEGPEMKIEDMRSFMQKRARELLRSKSVTNMNHAAITHAIFVQYLAKRGMTEEQGNGQTMAVVDFISDVGIKAPCVQFLQALVERSSAPVYMYEFSYFSSDDIRSGRQEWIGAYHESELQFVFGEPFLQYSNSLRSPIDLNISNMMMALWINFAKYGDPTPKAHNPLGNVTWDVYTAQHQTHLHIVDTPTMAENYLTESLLFWNAFVPILSDYPIQELKRKCVGTRNKWLLWTMVPIICLQTLVLGVLCLYVVRKRQNITRHAPLSPENSTAV